MRWLVRSSMLWCWSFVSILVVGCGQSDEAGSTPSITGAAGQAAVVPAAGSGAIAVSTAAGAAAAGANAAAAGANAVASVGTAGMSAVPAGGRAAAGAPAMPVAGASGSGASAAGSSGAAGSAAAGTGGSSGVAGAAGGTGAAGQPATGSCDFAEPDEAYAAWVEQSWNAQLGDNIENREAWILDNVMLNKGSMNLCVRWGATSAVPAEVHMNLAGTVERWFNDWFTGLAGYGCFPYGEGIEVKVTGWAVRPGSEALLEGIDPSIPVYTETDPEGEPKCPDTCSSFVHWDHAFPSCAAGAGMHHDYWLWFNDAPPQRGAAAVGGDWGLRMPVNTFLSAFAKPSDHIVEHEMGHGFGFQDYYDWTGATPEGGSIMIVGSTPSEKPTLADHWLLRRTWKEMKELRGW
jgi:hypothetical protein